MSETVLTERRGAVLSLTLNRPEVRNAMSQPMIAALIAQLDSAEADPDVRVITLRGAGGHFCAGGDIKEMAQARAEGGGSSGRESPGPDDPIRRLNAKFGQIALRFAQTDLVTVALIEGAVMGGGFGLACTTDIAIATQTADFRLPETSLGLVPAQIAPFLIERLGLSEARRLAVTGARLSAEDALRVGLVHHVCPSDELEQMLENALRGILRGAPLATRATKSLLRRLKSGVTADDIEHAAEVFARAARGDEAAEGASAFFAKRPAAWVSKA